MTLAKYSFLIPQQPKNGQPNALPKPPTSKVLWRQGYHCRGDPNFQYAVYRNRGAIPTIFILIITIFLHYTIPHRTLYCRENETNYGISNVDYGASSVGIQIEKTKGKLFSYQWKPEIQDPPLVITSIP